MKKAAGPCVVMKMSVNKSRFFGNIALGFMFAALSLALTSCTASPPRLDQVESVHLVIDAGSSGTRFCYFALRHSDDSCQSSILADPYSECREMEAENGLADLGEEKAEKLLAGVLDTMEEDLRTKLTGAALLGTGGFRRQTQARQNAIVKRLEKVFADRHLSAVVRVLSGEDEGRLAWRTMQSSVAGGHRTIETGGATIQYASGISYADTAAVSAPLGMNDSFEKLQHDSAFLVCYGDKKDYAGCKALLSGRIFRNSSIQKFMDSRPDSDSRRPLFGMGAPWKAVFRLAGNPDRISATALDELGRQTCSNSTEQLISRGIPAKHAPRTCYLLAFQAAFLSATGSSEIRRGGESWPRGASLTSDFFKDCPE